MIGRIGLLALLLASASGAQDPTFRTGVSLVRIDAQATDGNRILDGLHKEDFVVKENGAVQPLVAVSQDEVPLDLLLLFDVSRSMRPSMVRLAISAHTALSELRPGDRVAIADFDIEARLLAPFNENLEEVAAKVGDIVDVPYDLGTHILSAIDNAAKYFLRNGPATRRRAVLIFTDNEGQSSAREKSVVNRLWEADALVCGLIVKSGMSFGMASEDMLGVAEKTGGEVVNADDPGHTFREMLRHIRRRYSIYYEMPPGKAGTARKVTVELAPATHARYPNGQVVARKGYLVPKS